MKKAAGAIGAVAVVAIALVVIVAQRGDLPGVGVPPAPPGVVGNSTCGDLAAATEGATISLGGHLECDIVAPAPNVTVTGTVTGWLRCRTCNGWRISKLDLSGGNGTAALQMIGGDGWTIEDSTISGAGGPGSFGVIAIGETPENGPATNWKILRNTVKDPGNNPEHEDNQDHAIYVIGPNETPLNGLIEGNEILGGPAGHALKVGGTGKLRGYPDSSDAVTVRDNHIVGRLIFDGDCAVLITTNSDDVVIDKNRIECPDGGYPIGLSSFTGDNLKITDNVLTFNGDIWLLATGSRPGYDNLPPFECGSWATCSGNRRG